MIVSEKAARVAAETLALPWEDLHLDSDPVGRVALAFRMAARNTHPDMGGNAEAFAAVDRAKHVLLAWLEKPRTATPEHKKRACDYCKGSGRVHQPSGRPGSNGLMRTCPKCHGSGDADYDAR